MTQRSPESFSWRGPQFYYKKKTPLWYTNIAVVFFAVFVGLLFLKNVLGMAVVAFAFWYFLTQANHRPKTVDYAINALGIHIDDRRIGFETIESFSAYPIGSTTVYFLDPIAPFTFPVTLVAKSSDAETISQHLLQHVPQRPRPPFFVRLTHYLHY